MAGEERWGGGSGINSLWLAHLPRGIRPDYQDFRRSVNEPAEWTDPAEIRMRVALHFIKAKGKRPRMEKESLGGEGGKEGSNGVHVGPITSRPHEIHRPCSLTKARASTEHNKFQCFSPPPLFLLIIII